MIRPLMGLQALRLGLFALAGLCFLLSCCRGKKLLALYWAVVALYWAGNCMAA